MSLTRAFLEIVDGPGKGRRILLREGQVRYVGRTDQADDSCPENLTMSSVHFSVRWFAGKCEVKDLNSANGTWRDGKKIHESLLSHGDEIKAGKATFRVLVDDGSATHSFMPLETQPGDIRLDLPPAPHVAAPGEAARDPVLATGLVVATAAALPPTAQLSDASKSMLVDDMPVQQFIELLASREQYLDALRVVANSLAKRSAVDWACRCVRAASGDDLSPPDAAAVAAAEAWVQEPSEGHRRKAQAAADAAGNATPASWAATAAFWSTGSMAPPAAPVVPPAPHLTAHAASGAVMLAAVARQPEKAPEKYQQFLDIGREMMANGEVR
jgi:pSer/pThr/pTyr-binding forkhead associated (FHA) protein